MSEQSEMIEAREELVVDKLMEIKQLKAELSTLKQAAREFIDAYYYEPDNTAEIKHNLERLVK